MDARGMFSEEENYVVLVVVNCRQIADFFDIIKNIRKLLLITRKLRVFAESFGGE